MKSETLKFRVSDAEKRTFQDAAELAGIPVSAWVRERLRWSATRELEAADKEVAFLRISANDVQQ